MAEIHVGDIGTAFRATVKDEDGAIVNIASAASMLMWFQKPDGTVVSRTASLVNDGVDGLMQYITQAGDLDQAGSWKSQGVVDIGGGRWHSDISKFKVYANLKAD